MRVGFMKMVRHISGGGAFRLALNAFLLAACAALIAVNVSIWSGPLLVYPAAPTENAKGPVSVAAPGKAKARLAELKRNPFELETVKARGVTPPRRVAAKAVTAPPAPPAPPAAPAAPPSKPVPKFTLVGTALLNKQGIAVIRYPGGSKMSYRTGDPIEDFILREIRNDSVVLARDGQEVRLTMSEPLAATATQGQLPQGAQTPQAQAPKPPPSGDQVKQAGSPIHGFKVAPVTRQP